MNADDRNLLAELNAAINDDGEDAGPSTGPMTAATWGCCPAPRRPGELLTRGDVCHVHADRAAAARCGVLLRVPTRFVRKYTLTARPEPSTAQDAVEGGMGHARGGSVRGVVSQRRTTAVRERSESRG